MAKLNQGKFFLLSDNSPVFLFKNLPDMGTPYRPENVCIADSDMVKSVVLVLDNNLESQNEEFLKYANLYYKILFKNGEIFWVHAYDVIAIDQTTGKPIENY